MQIYSQPTHILDPRTAKGNEAIAKFANEGHWEIWKLDEYKRSWSGKYPTKEAALEAVEQWDKRAALVYSKEALDKLQKVFRNTAQHCCPRYHDGYTDLFRAVHKINDLDESEFSGTGLAVFTMLRQNVIGHTIINPLSDIWEDVFAFCEWYNNYNK